MDYFYSETHMFKCEVNHYAKKGITLIEDKQDRNVAVLEYNGKTISVEKGRMLASMIKEDEILEKLGYVSPVRQAVCTLPPCKG
jgi:hypothetical protein